MFEKDRMISIHKGVDVSKLKNEIIEILKMHKLSLSETRALFNEIIIDIEDNPL